MKRRVLLTIGSAALGTVLLPSTARAQEKSYPNRPVQLVVPYSPGGATDLLGRSLAQKLGDVLGQQVVVQNRAGAGGNIGAASVANAPADGYTLLIGTIGTHAINGSLYKSMPFDPLTDFSPVSLMLTNQLVLLVNPELPVRTASELIEYSKKPDSKLFFGSAGNGSSHHLAGELLKSRSGLRMTHVPYKGSGPALLDLIGGAVQVLFVDIAGALPYIRAGKIRPLAVGGKSRSTLMPELPTIAEAANLPGFDVSAWMGIFAPRGTPHAVLTRLNGALREVLGMSEITERFAGLGAEPLYSTPDELQAHVKSESAKWATIVKAAGVTIE